MSLITQATLRTKWPRYWWIKAQWWALPWHNQQEPSSRYDCLFLMSRAQPRCIWPNQSLLLWMGQLTKYGWPIIAHSTDLPGIVWPVVLSWPSCATWGWWRRTARWDFLTGGEVKCLNFYLKDLSFPISFSLYRFGVPLIDGGTVRLPKLIGLSRAMDLILTGRMLDPKVWRIADHICEHNFFPFETAINQLLILLSISIFYMGWIP